MTALPEGIEPEVPVPGYPNTWTHTPAQPLLPRPAGRTEMAGPVRLHRKLVPGAVNLAEATPGRPAIGQLMQIGGRILDEAGRPVAGAVVELWQANAAGRYAHANDGSAAPLDPNFTGHGRALTDEDGRYAFTTIKPGAYAVPVQETWWRPPHLHFSVHGPSCLSRLVTQMYFPGEPLNALDRILNAIPDGAARSRMIARFLPPPSVGDFFLGFTHDIVLRGRHATPEA
ncbi:protocatechuate 3,4-dioxygenase subunit beta [Falsiroseomonas bella]|uniref:Protocatechuate 3,4-dioxygenase subunit beta n=1 Tax=Falsiroseomonas bella TaxID=2184016 RepID=A0A317FC56_9PROT|nr:protocatechuate 3,4-dioxygenase subunit beta [Falsiroseomonas bella]PWS36415.1 protocatechuate 3,4-dioxygenase subunit beta [Falsiroseomonas bella]